MLRSLVAVYTLLQILLILISLTLVVAVPTQTVNPDTNEKSLLRNQKVTGHQPLSAADGTIVESKVHHQQRCPIEDQSVRCGLVRLQDRLNRMETIVFNVIGITERVIAKLPDPECYPSHRKLPK